MSRTTFLIVVTVALAAACASNPALNIPPENDAPAWAISACGLHPVVCLDGVDCCPSQFACCGPFPESSCPADECEAASATDGVLAARQRMPKKHKPADR